MVAPQGLSTPYANSSPSTGANFDHIVIIAMENQNYQAVLGDGTLAGCPVGTAPFLCSLLPLSSTIPNYHSYGAGAFSGDSVSGCSAACYVALVSGSTHGVSDGYCNTLSGCPSSPTWNQANIISQLSAAGLTWQAYCAGGCPRYADHFPFLAFSNTYNSPNVFTSSSVTTSTFIAQANLATPPNFLWYTPTDDQNMHDNSISSGDSYLKSFLVGTGTISTPAAGSLLASNLFRSYHTMLYLWWDEYSPSPNIEFGPTIKAGYVSPSSTYDEYASLHSIENNWGLPTLLYASQAAIMSDLFQSPIVQPVLTTTSVINSGAYPTRADSEKHVYSSKGVPSAGTLVQISNAKLSNVFNGAASGDCNDSTDSPQPPSGTWCDSVAEAADSTGAVRVEIDQVYKYLGIAPPDWPGNGSTVNIVGYTFSDNETPGGWEIHPVTAWTLVSSPPRTFSLTISADAGGTTNPAPGAYSETSGSTVSVTAIPSSGYTFTSFSLDSVVSTANPISVTMAANHALKASFTQSVSTPGNFGSCTSLPQGWSCGNTNGLAGSVATITNGVAETVQYSQGVGNDTNYYYSTTQKGTFPWSPCQVPASGVLPTGLSSVKATFKVNSFQPFGTYRYHVYIALYYWLPNGALTSGGKTYQCLEAQSRVENINGVFSPVGSNATYDPGDSFGWDQVTLGSVSLGGTYTLTANVQQQCQSDLVAWGLPTNTPCQLAGIEIGVEGYQFSLLNVSWPSVTLSTGGPVPISDNFSYSPTTPNVGQIITFTSAVSGGTSPYTVKWSFGDGTTGTGSSAAHTYSSAGSFSVTETVTDSSSPQQTSSSTQFITVSTPPPTLTSNFTISPSSPQTGQSVIFTASTSGGTPPFTFTWSFGDGSTGTGSSSTHAYSSGSYAVTLTVKDSGSPQQSATSKHTISVVSPPPPLTSNFSYSPSSPHTGQQVSFTGSASGGTSPYAFSWAFGDGSTGTGSSVTHTYSSVGSYSVTVTVNDKGSPQQIATFQKTVAVTSPPPPLSTSFTFTPSSPQISQQVTFTGSASGGISPYTFSWSFGDGSSGTGSTMTHTYSSSGTITVTLTVRDSGSPQQSTTSQQTVTVSSPPLPLTASFSYGPSSPRVGETVSFTSSASGGTSPYGYSWTYGDGSTSTGSSPTHAYSSAGTFTVTLTVKDSGSPQLTVSSQKTVTVTSPPPPLTASFSFSPSSPPTGQQVTFTGSATGGTLPYAFSWDFGDGTTGTGSATQHSYASPGTFTVTLTVTDSSSSQETATSRQTIAVSSPPPPLTAGFDYSPLSPQTGQAVAFTGSASGGTSPYTYTWNFGDGSTGTGASVTHSYSSAGAFTVTLTVKDNGFAQQNTSSQQSITVTTPLLPLTTNFTFNPSLPETGQQVKFTASASGGTSPDTFNWSFGDGSTGTGSSATHAYPTAGAYTVILTATDGGSPQQSATFRQIIAVAPPLTLSFTFSPSAPEAGEVITLSATAAGGTPSYAFSWSFGDGESSVANPVTHIYSSSGSFNVTVTVIDSSGTETRLSQPISLAERLTVSFNYSPATPEATLPATFTATSKGGISPITFSWTFGDDSSSIGSATVHTYTTSGDFTIAMNATDANGVVATFSQTALVAAPLNVNFTINPPTLLVNESATLTASTTGGVGTPSFDWNFGDGTSSTSNRATHSYTAAGSFTVTVTATDSDGIIITSNQTVLVNTVVAASFTYSPSSPKVREPVLFTSSASGGDSPYNYSWSFGDSSTATGPSVIHTYTSAGSFNVTLTVLDNGSPQQTVESTQFISVLSQPVGLNVSFTYSPPSPQVGQQVAFNASAIGGTSPYNFTWSFGDESTGSGNVTSHVFDSANTYFVVLVVTDANGTTFSIAESITVTVSPNPPIALTVPSEESVAEGSSLTFNVTATENSVMQISISCASCLGLGANFTSSTGPGAASGIFNWTPSETQVPGVYAIVISSTDGTQVANATVTITVIEIDLPPVIQVPASLTVRDGEILQFTLSVTDPDASVDNITFTAIGLPDGASLDPTTGIFYWPVQGVHPGPYTITFTATDNENPPLQDNATILVHVDNGNGPCFICNMFLSSQLPLNSSPLNLILKTLATLIGTLTVLTVKYGVGWWRRKTDN